MYSEEGGGTCMKGAVTGRGKWNMEQGVETWKGAVVPARGGTGVVPPRLGHKKWSNSQFGVENPKKNII